MSRRAETASQRPGRRHPAIRRVFISSTSVDLLAHRERIRDTLLRLNLFPVGMEHWGAQGSGDATSVSLDKLHESDIYLGLVAWRYGSIPAGETRSVTHLEYEEAKQQPGMPCLIFLADPATDAADGPDDLFPAVVRDPEHRAPLLAFRAELERENLRDYFTTPDDLGRRVATALYPYLPEGLRPPHDLPPRIPGFVGRESDLQTLIATLRAGQSVGLSAAVAGMAGVGKSALAVEVVYRLAADPDAFLGGTTWVRCDERTGLAGLAWVYDQVLAAWDLTLAPEEIGRAATPTAAVELRERALRFRLGPRLADKAGVPTPALVLLDNVERDLPLARALDTLTPLGITVLVTTRYEPSSPHLRLFKLDVLERDAAIQLFAERYADRGGVWDVAHDAEAGAEIVKALGCLPLAIELAAARAAREGLGVAALAVELRQPDVLSRLRDPQDPTASVRYAFEKSLRLLNSTQRVRFAALGLPEGPDWPRSVIERLLVAVPPDAAMAADAAAMTDTRTAGDDLDLLGALSLVTLFVSAPLVPTGGAAPRTARSLPRVRLHPLLRELAREEWAGQPHATRQAGLPALLTAVCALVEAHADDFATLGREEELIAGTLRHASQERIEPRQIIEAVVTLFNYLFIGSHWQLGMELLMLLLAICREVGDRAGEGRTLNNLGSLAHYQGRLGEAQRYHEQALTILREVGDRRVEGRTLSNLGSLAYAQGRLGEAQAYYEQALAIQRAVGDRAGEGATLGELGSLAYAQGGPTEAQRYHEQALAIQRAVGDRAGEGRTLNNLGSLVEGQARRAEAQAYYEQALAILRGVGDRAGEGATLSNLGRVAANQGRLGEARAYYDEALAILRGVGDRAAEGATLQNLGNLVEGQGRWTEAQAYYEQVLTIAREVGDRRAEGKMLHNLGQVAANLGLLAANQGQRAQAQAHLAQALAIQRAVGDRAGEGATLNNLGRVAANQGRLGEARAYYDEALAILRGVGDRAAEGATLQNLGSLAQAQGRLGQAQAYYEQALAIQHAVGDRAGEGATLHNLGQVAANQGLLAANQGRRVEAQAYYDEALAILREVGDRAGEGRTLNNLGSLAQAQGRRAAAQAYYEQALVIQRAVGDRAGEGATLSNLGSLVEDQGRLGQAQVYYEQALAILREVGDRAGEGRTLGELGSLAQAQGRRAAAQAYFAQALAIFEEIGLVNEVQIARKNLATLKKRRR
jgi:tetratricopeptide (TPR) repeat protein